MAFIHRLIVLFLIMASGSASAVILPEPSVPEYSIFTNGPWFKNKQAACSYWASTGNDTATLEEPLRCILSGGYGQYLYQRAAAPTCPAGSNSTLAPSGVECTCATGDQEVNGICKPISDELCGPLTGLVTPSEPNSIQISGMTTAGMQAALGQRRNLCTLGCVASGIVQAGLRANDGSTTLIVGGAKFTGAKCTTQPQGGDGSGTAPEPEAGPPSACSQQNKCPGTVNGVEICVPCSATGTGSPAPSTTVTTSTTAGTGTSGGGTGGSGGSSSSGGTGSGSSTVCSAGTCTTTTTVTAGTTTSTTTSSTTGTSGTTTTTVESQTEYCAKNPTVVVCQKSGSFGGSCASGFEATGDALDAATAKAINKVKCLLDAGSGLDPVVASLTAGTFASDLTVRAKSVTNFDQTNPLGSGCPPDQSMSVFGTTVLIPLATMCPYLEAMGKIAILITLIYSTLFVVKGLN